MFIISKYTVLKFLIFEFIIFVCLGIKKDDTAMYEQLRKSVKSGNSTLKVTKKLKKVWGKEIDFSE